MGRRLFFDDETKGRAIVEVARGLSLDRVAVRLGVNKATIERERRRSPDFDSALVAASEGRIRPVASNVCPGENCGTARGYDWYSCRQEPCAAAVRKPSSLDDEQVRKRIITIILEEYICTGDALAEVAKQEGLNLRQLWRRMTWDQIWREQLDCALLAARDPNIEHGKWRSYITEKCKCGDCRSYWNAFTVGRSPE